MTVIRGRRVSKGRGEGEALVTTQPISFLAGVDPDRGVVIDRDHELRGQCITDKILVFPRSKGSTGSTWILMRLADNKTAPTAIINVETDPIIATGSILAGIPLIDKLDKDPTVLIKTGDYVIVDADKSLVEILHL
jgi:predicted aconitase with swiveling domain